MPVSLSFRDDPRIGAYATWIAKDVEAGIRHVGVLRWAIHATIQIKEAPIDSSLVPQFALKLHRILMKLLEQGIFLIDETGGVNETIASAEEIETRLKGEGYSFAAIFAQAPSDLQPLPDRDIGTADETQEPSDIVDALIGAFPVISSILPGDGELATFVELAQQANVAYRSVRHFGSQLMPQLDRSVVEVGASVQQLPIPGNAPVFDGRGVIVGVIDFGCDFAHPNFRRPGGGSRILWIWDINEGPPVVSPPLPPTLPPLLPPLPPPPLPGVRWPGRGLYRAHIDAALSNTETSPNYVQPDDQPYHLLHYHPHDNYYQDEVEGGAHGTFVLDVASGNGRASRGEERYRPGVAPGADIVFVQMPKPELIGGRRRFDPWAVVMGVAAVFDWAERHSQPAVVNISLNGTEGPHDGVSPYDFVLNWLCRRKPGRAVVVGSGNFYETRRHARAVVNEGASVVLTWRFAAEDTHRSEMEIWYDLPNANPQMLRVVLMTPWGESMAVEPGATSIVLRNGQQVGYVRNLAHDPFPLGQRERRLIYLWVEPHEKGRQPAGVEDWRVRLEVADPYATNVSVRFNAWISRDDEATTAFAGNCSEPEQTLGTIACFEEAIVVGAYSFVDGNRVPCPFSSAGPTRDDRQVPDIAAPGRGVWAAKSTGFRIRYPGTGTQWRKSSAFVMDGTSTAAPFVAGTVALMLQKNPQLTNAGIKSRLRQSARPVPSSLPLNAPGWDPQLGGGLLSASRAVIIS